MGLASERECEHTEFVPEREFGVWGLGYRSVEGLVTFRVKDLGYRF